MNPYKVLGLDKTATEQEIKKRYRKLSMKLHPDRGGDEEAFKKVAEAYGILSDKTKKANYDRYGDAGGVKGNPFAGNPFADHPFNDFMRQHRRGARQAQQRGGDLRVTISLTLEEIYSGIDKTIKYKRNILCGDCDGHGGHNPRDCNKCGGNGVEIRVTNTLGGMRQMQVTCSKCHGRGKSFSSSCGTCHTKGLKLKEETVVVEIPKGVKSGDNIRYGTMGSEVKNGINGDLQVVIDEMAHTSFNRSGNDVYFKLKKPYYSVLLGMDINLKLLDNSNIKVSIPEKTKHGEKLRLKGKGLPLYNSRNFGDLIIDVEMTFDDVDEVDLEVLKGMSEKKSEKK